MPDLTVDPSDLKQLAKKQADASEQAGQAAKATNGLCADLLRSWGPYWAPMIDKFAHANHARTHAIARLQMSCAYAEYLLTFAGETYANTDATVAEALNQQLPAR